MRSMWCKDNLILLNQDIIPRMTNSKAQMPNDER